VSVDEPFICNLAPGEVVPMPKLPDESIRIRSCILLVSKTKASLDVYSNPPLVVSLSPKVKKAELPSLEFIFTCAVVSFICKIELGEAVPIPTFSEESKVMPLLPTAVPPPFCICNLLVEFSKIICA
jgi:hypothetical protein